jgi:hypothetical protein
MLLTLYSSRGSFAVLDIVLVVVTLRGLCLSIL